MDKCTIIQQVSEWKRSNGATFQKKMMEKKRSKSNFKCPISYVGTRCSATYVQPSSFHKSSSDNKNSNDTFQKKKKTPRYGNVQDEDNIGTDPPIVLHEKRRSSTSSVITEATVSSEDSWISYCQTSSNSFSVGKECRYDDDFDDQSSTSIPSIYSHQSSVQRPSFRRLLSSMSTDSLLFVENEEERFE